MTPRLYVGLDGSTQSLSAILIEVEQFRARVAWQHALNFDEAFPVFGTTHGVLPSDDPLVKVAPPEMWAAALDTMMRCIARSGVLARRTGSRACHRFTGPQIRKFYETDPHAYAGTARIHLVSSFLASQLIGSDAPLGPGDASGMNLMDLATRGWWPDAVAATAPGLASRLPAIVPANSVIGDLAPAWQRRFGLPPARVVAWTGDNPSSFIGTGLIEEGHVFGAPTPLQSPPAGYGRVRRLWPHMHKCARGMPRLNVRPRRRRRSTMAPRFPGGSHDDVRTGPTRSHRIPRFLPRQESAVPASR